MPTNRATKPRGRIFNPIRSRIMLPVMIVAGIATKWLGLTELESATWLLAIALMLTWGWVWDVADRLEQVEKQIADEAEQRHVAHLASQGRAPKGRFTQDSGEG